MRLRTKYAVVLLVATAVLTASVYGGLELYKDQLVRQTQAEVDETAALTAEQIDTVVRDRKDFVGFAASRPAAARFDRGEAYLASLVGNSRFFAGQLVAADGTIVAFHGDVTGSIREEAIGRDVGDRPYVRAALAGEVYVSELEYANATGAYVAVISAPVFAEREIVGVLALATYVDERTFFPMLGPIETSDQTVAVRDGDKPLYGDGDVPEEAITATATAEETGWTVRVARDRGDLTAQLELLAFGQGLGLSAVLLAVFGFAVWEYRTTLRQIERLLAGFGALEAGDYDHPLSLAAAEEWQQISDGFNALAGALAARERELRERKQRLEVLNRVLRHNLRNRAGVLLGYGEQVRDQADDPQLARAGSVMVETVRDLTALGEKARQVEMALERSEDGPVAVEAVAVVRGAVERAREAHPGVTVEASLPAAAWVYATPALDLVVENLLENACEHNDGPDPRVDVAVSTTGPDGARAAISVADNGPGIPQEERQVIAEGRETPLEHGSGLGLWLAHWAVERVGGELRFDDADGGGTVVAVELDAVPPGDRPSDEAAPPVGSGDAADDVRRDSVDAPAAVEARPGAPSRERSGVGEGTHVDAGTGIGEATRLGGASRAEALETGLTALAEELRDRTGRWYRGSRRQLGRHGETARAAGRERTRAARAWYVAEASPALRSANERLRQLRTRVADVLSTNRK